MNAIPSRAVELGKPNDFDQMIAGAAAGGADHLLPLLRAVRAGRLDLVIVERGGNVSFKRLKQFRRPVLVLVGDDDYASTGPTGWLDVVRLVRWARYAMIHATGATQEIYAAAVDGAVVQRRFLLVETDSAHAHAWADAMQGTRPPVPFLGVLPADGPHPVMPARGDLH